MSEADFDDVISVNLKGVFLVCVLSVPYHHPCLGATSVRVAMVPVICLCRHLRGWQRSPCTAQAAGCDWRGVRLKGGQVACSSAQIMVHSREGVKVLTVGHLM